MVGFFDYNILKQLIGFSHSMPVDEAYMFFRCPRRLAFKGYYKTEKNEVTSIASSITPYKIRALGVIGEQAVKEEALRRILHNIGPEEKPQVESPSGRLGRILSRLIKTINSLLGSSKRLDRDSILRAILLGQKRSIQDELENAKNIIKSALMYVSRRHYQTVSKHVQTLFHQLEDIFGSLVGYGEAIIKSSLYQRNIFRGQADALLFFRRGVVLVEIKNTARRESRHAFQAKFYTDLAAQLGGAIFVRNYIGEKICFEPIMREEVIPLVLYVRRGELVRPEEVIRYDFDPVKFWRAKYIISQNKIPKETNKASCMTCFYGVICRKIPTDKLVSIEETEFVPPSLQLAQQLANHIDFNKIYLWYHIQTTREYIFNIIDRITNNVICNHSRILKEIDKLPCIASRYGYTP